MFLTVLPLLGSALTMVANNAGRLIRASAFALLPLGACATETQGLQEDLSQLEPLGGSGGSPEVPTAGTPAGGTPGASGTFPSGGGDGPVGGMFGTAGTGAGTGGVPGGGGGMGGATGGGGSAGAGGAGGKGGAGGSGGTPPNPCATGQLDIDAATASSEENGNLTPNLAFDGDDMSRWASAQGIDPQWIYFDLGEVAHVSRVQISWEAAYATSYRLEIAQSSNGPWTSIFEENAGNGAMDNVTTLTASDGRYVRMYGITRATMYGFSIWEFEIYGDLDETCQ
jgi:hypothetical protein